MSPTGAKFVEAAWAVEPRVPRNSLGCRLRGVLSLRRLWGNANLRAGRETRAWAQAKSAGGCAGSCLYLRPPSLVSSPIVVGQGHGRQVSWRAGCRDPRATGVKRKGEASGHCRVDTAAPALAEAYDSGTCSSWLFERPSRAPGKWRIAETGNYFSQKAGRSRGHRESTPVGSSSPAQWGRSWGQVAAARPPRGPSRGGPPVQRIRGPRAEPMISSVARPDCCGGLDNIDFRQVLSALGAGVPEKASGWLVGCAGLRAPPPTPGGRAHCYPATGAGRGVKRGCVWRACARVCERGSGMEGLEFLSVYQRAL